MDGSRAEQHLLYERRVEAPLLTPRSRSRLVPLPPRDRVQPAPRPLVAEAAESVSCRTITTEAEFYALQRPWRELLSQTAVPSAFRSWEFVVEWFRVFVKGGAAGATGRFQVLIATKPDGQIVGLIPLFEEKITRDKRAVGTSLRPFGWSASFDGMTDEPVALFRKGYEAAAARAFKVESARQRKLGGWDLAIIAGPVSQRSRTTRPAFTDGFGGVEVTRHRPGPMTVRLPRSWIEFKAQLSKSMRDNIAHYPRKLSREVGRWMLREARSPHDVAEATEALINLHRQRSLSKVGSPHISHIPTDLHATFLRHWFQRMAWRNQMSIFTIEIDGEIVAAQVFLEAASVLSVYYSGFNDRWHRYSPLTIIMTAAIRSAMARKFGCLDFPPVPRAWKSRWGATEKGGVSRTYIYSTSVPSILRGAARQVVQTTGFGARLSKRWVHECSELTARLLGRTPLR